MTFGSWAIEESLYNHIKTFLPEGKTIIELGSGTGTIELLKHWNVVSVEHSEKYADRLTNTCIFAPLTEHKALKNHEGPMKWYDRDILIPALEGLEYDLLLVDGPPGDTRCGIVKYIGLFYPEVPMIFDDLQRSADRKIINSVAAKLGKPFTTYGYLPGKPFGVINDPS